MPTYDLEAVAQAICNSSGMQYIKPVGLGSFKETYLINSNVGAPSALKILKPGCSSERTARELEAMAKCSHPNIVPSAELSQIEYNGLMYEYLTEEFMHGGTLADRLEPGPLTRNQLLDLGKSLISALSHISSHGLVHRDFKPANIMFRDSGFDGVVCDFGIVRDLAKSSLTKTYMVMGPGSPFFAAPEQLRNEKNLIDWRTDQFSLGVTLSLAYFGFHPYQPTDRADPNKTIEAVINRSGPSFTFKSLAETHGLPVLTKMVSPWPIQRFRIATELQSFWSQQEV